MNDNGTVDEKDNSVTHGPLRRKWPFLVVWLGINALDAVWITYYVRAATDPNPRTAVNKSHAGWQAYYLIMYVFGFFLGCVNLVVALWYFQATRSPAGIRTRKSDSRILNLAWRTARILVLVPVSVILVSGPFFAPVVGVKLAQEQAWIHRCDPFPVEIILTGLSFNAPGTATPIATFSLRENGIVGSTYVYTLGVNGSIWHFGPSPGQSPVTSQLPTVTYNIDNSSLMATCSGNTSQCTQGTFQESGVLSFALTNSFSSTHVNSRAVDRDWVYGKSDDAPSFILKEVNPDGSLGDVVVRTAVTQPGHCSVLKMCANGATVEALAPVGLTLMKQNEYSKVCTTPNSN
ncbi:hypothetical protein FB451DRAFT_571535 [Mycena latifolia]|nr:hypothetical protein FB451DRAFT_571535 [Mycena latifolia]